MKKDWKQMKKGTLAVIIVAVVAIVAVAAVWLSGSNTNLLKSDKIVEMEYGFSIQIPAQYVDMVEHTQEQYGDRVTEVFVLKEGEAEISLFCIDFGDRQSGDWLGLLNIDGVNVPITYTIFLPDEEEMSKFGEKGLEAYDAMRESFSNLLNTITADPRFMMEEVQAEQEKLVIGKLVEMTYWSVNLPEAIKFEETNQDGVYQADFFGEVAGEQILLYSVRIGGDSLQSELSLFEIDGVKKIVSVESNSLSDRNDWSQSEFETAFRMMDTINEVIEQIMSSEHYSEE